MQSLTRVFSRASNDLETTVGMSTSIRFAIENVLLTVSSECATTLYSELCRVQMARDGSIDLRLSAPFVILSEIDFTSEDAVKRFHSAFIDDGWLIDRVADAIELPSDERKRKWNTQRSNAALAARLHHQMSLDHQHWSVFLLESRDMNRIAYDSVRAALQKKGLSKPTEWQSLILETPGRLKRRELAFWRALQVSNCTISEKRAVCHKLEQCREVAPSSVVPHLTRSISQDIYLLSRAKHERVSTRPMFARFWRRLFKRRAVVERCDSSTSAPGFRPYA